MFDIDNIHMDKNNVYWVCDYIGASRQQLSYIHSMFLSNVRTKAGKNNSRADLKYDDYLSLFIQSTDYQLVKDLATNLNKQIQLLN